jgi:hypothetical protein
MNKLLFILISILNICSSFQLPMRQNNLFYKDNYQFHIKNGVIYGNVVDCLNPYLDKDINRKIYNYHITFKYNHSYSLINIEYKKNDDNRVLLNTYKMIKLRNVNDKEHRENNMMNISTFIEQISNWRGRFRTITSNMKYLDNKIYDVDSYDFRYFFVDINNKKRVCCIDNNLILSVPEEIDNYKAFTLVFGCLLDDNNYNQVNMNYNYNGYMTNIDLYEYKPKIKYMKNFMLVEMLRQLFICM